MLRIGICDENTKDRTVIRQIVTDTLFREEELSYIEYAEAETLEQEIQASTVPFDLLLMEMKYKNTSGLQLAKQIREKNLDVDLLFVTDESDHVYEGYHVQAQKRRYEDTASRLSAAIYETTGADWYDSCEIRVGCAQYSDCHNPLYRKPRQSAVVTYKKRSDSILWKAGGY